MSEVIINKTRYECPPAIAAYVKELDKYNKVLLSDIAKKLEEIEELKTENARFKELYQKLVGVIAATDCVECKDKAVKHGGTENLWVSCNERMPETLTETLDGWYSECCLVFAEETEWMGMAYYRTNDNKSWWEFADAQNKPKIDWAEITHWMPLPNYPNCGAKMDGGTDWKLRYEAAKDYRDEHWDAEERHAHQEYVEAMEKAIYALETVYELKKIGLTDEEISGRYEMETATLLQRAFCTAEYETDGDADDDR